MYYIPPILQKYEAIPRDTISTRIEMFQRNETNEIV